MIKLFNLEVPGNFYIWNELEDFEQKKKSYQLRSLPKPGSMSPAHSVSLSLTSINFILLLKKKEIKIRELFKTISDLLWIKASCFSVYNRNHQLRTADLEGAFWTITSSPYQWGRSWTWWNRRTNRWLCSQISSATELSSRTRVHQVFFSSVGCSEHMRQSCDLR